MSFPVLFTSGALDGTFPVGGTVLPAIASTIPGNLVLWTVTMASPGAGTVTGSPGWTRIVGNVIGPFEGYYAVFARVLDGSADDTLRVGSSLGLLRDFMARGIAYLNHGVSTPATDIYVSALATGTSTNPNCPNGNPGVTRDWSWLALCGVAGSAGSFSFTGIPTNSFLQLVASINATGEGLAITHRNQNASSLDPNQYATSASRDWVAVTVAIPPSADAIDVPCGYCSTGPAPVTARAQVGVPEMTPVNDFSVIMLIRKQNWSVTGSAHLVGEWTTVGNQRSWLVSLESGYPSISRSTNGTNTASLTIPTTLGSGVGRIDYWVNGGEWCWFAASFDGIDGANHRARFFLGFEEEDLSLVQFVQIGTVTATGNVALNPSTPSTWFAHDATNLDPADRLDIAYMALRTSTDITPTGGPQVFLYDGRVDLTGWAATPVVFVSSSGHDVFLLDAGTGDLSTTACPVDPTDLANTRGCSAPGVPLTEVA